MAKIDLDWNIDDDEGEGDWEPQGRARQKSPDPAEARAPARWRGLRLQRRGWLLVLGAVSLLAGVPTAWGAWRWRQAAEEQRAAVTRLARLEDELLAKGDREALLALQDQDPPWRTWQLFAGFYYAAPQFMDRGEGWPPLTSLAGDYEVVVGTNDYGEVQLDGEQARLVVTRHYALREKRVATRLPFALQQTQYDRLVNGGWVRSGPPALPDPAMIRAPGRFLRLLYPARDAHALAPLAGRLEALAAQTCEDLGCPTGGPSLIITAALQDLLPTREVAGLMTAYAPAPGLVGMPDDASDRDVLYRLYATHIVAVVAANAAGARGEDLWPWYDWELAHLGLASPPFSESDLQKIARQAVDDGINPLAGSDELEPGVWLALDFMTQTTGKSPLRTLLAPNNPFTMRTQLGIFVQARAEAWKNYLEHVATPQGREGRAVQLAVVCAGQVNLWEVDTDQLRPLHMTNSGGPVWSPGLMWSPDGTRLIAPFSRKSFTVLDLTAGSVRDGVELPLAWAPDSKNVAVLFSGSRFIWHFATPETNLLTFVASESGWIGWSPDERYVAFAAHKRTWYQEDTASALQIYLLAAEREVWRAQAIAPGDLAAWSADGRYLALTSRYAYSPTINVYDVTLGQMVAVITPTLNKRIYDLAWSPTSMLLAVASWKLRDGQVQILDTTHENAVLETWPVDDIPDHLHWSPDGRELAWGLSGFADGHYTILIGSVTPGPARDGDARVPRDPPVQRLDALASFPYSPASSWSPDGRWLAFENDGVVVWSRDDQIERRLPRDCHAPAWRPVPGVDSRQSGVGNP